MISQKSQIISLLWQHIQLTLIAIIFAIIIGIPLGILVSKNEKIITYNEINGKKLKFKQIRKNRNET